MLMFHHRPLSTICHLCYALLHHMFRERNVVHSLRYMKVSVHFGYSSLTEVSFK